MNKLEQLIYKVEKISYEKGIYGHIASASSAILGIDYLYDGLYKEAAFFGVASIGIEVTEYFMRKKRQTIIRAHNMAVNAQKELEASQK